MDPYEHEPRLISRRAWIGVATLGVSAAVGLGLEGFLFGPRRVVVTRHWLEWPGHGGRGARSGIVRAAQVSDLHLRDLGATEEAVLEILHREEPDLILLTGDTIDDARNLELLDSFLRELPRASQRIAILGNWENKSRIRPERLRAVYEAKDCALLVNESVQVDAGTLPIHAVGLDNSVNGDPDLAAALDGLPDAGARLYLAHCPAQREHILADLAALGGRPDGVLLSGHTHGGQVRVLGFAPALPRESGGYVSGWYRGSGLDLYVSRGVGTSTLPVRFGAAPEVAIFEWSRNERGDLV